MEGFVNGILHTFDGLTDQDGKVVFSTSHIFSQGIMETVNEDRDLFYYSQRTIPPDLEKAGLDTVRAFGIKEKFFHLEYFRTIPDNRIVGLEVNMRPPWRADKWICSTTPMTLHLYQEWASIVMHNRFTADYSRRLPLAPTSAKNRAKAISTTMKKFRLRRDTLLYTRKRSTPYSAPLSEIMAILSVQADLDELIEAGRYIQQIA